MEEHYPYVLPPLRYEYDELEPQLSARTLRFHHDRRFAASVDRLNGLLRDEPAYQHWPLEKLCREWTEFPGDSRRMCGVCAGAVFNHSLYFDNLAALPVSALAPPLDGGISRAFGTMDVLFNTMKNAAKTHCGDGWLWLCADVDGDLSVVCTDGENTPLPLFPLVCCDLWEHAYYLDYQDAVGEYFDNWWRLVNWPKVSAAYDDWLSRRLPIPQP
jgi:superoxide dismutase, Fe-Mn family